MKHLAQLNIGRIKAPLDHPSMKEFVDFIDPVNKLGEDSPGFVWRLQDDGGGGSSYLENPFNDDRIIVNFTVWENLESLKAFTYQTVHTYFLKSRMKWFEKSDEDHVVMWWIPKGYIPKLLEAKEKLELLRKEGPGPEAFNLKEMYDHQGNKL